MAASESEKTSTSGCKFPFPITFDDEVPSAEFCRILLTIEGMKVQKPKVKLFGKPKVLNAEIKASFNDGVQVDVVVNGKQLCYQYRKQLPYDVIADRCKWEVMATEPHPRVAVFLAKAARGSWAAQEKHFKRPPDSE